MVTLAPARIAHTMAVARITIAASPMDWVSLIVDRLAHEVGARRPDPMSIEIVSRRREVRFGANV